MPSLLYTIRKHVRFIALLLSLGAIVPFEILRLVILLPTRYRLPVKSWTQIDHFRIRVIRWSLSLAVTYNTWNAFDWHVAGLLHKSSDRVKIARWPDFKNKGLLEGSGVSDEIPAKEKLGTFDALWFRPKVNENDKEVILYFHGGGYVLQFYDDPLYYKLTARLAKDLKRTLLSVDYRHGHGAPFPYHLQDAVSAYRYLLKQGYKPENIIISGDSAGGNLSLATLQYLVSRGAQDKLPVPRRALLISPWVDLRVTDVYTPEAITKLATDYIPGNMGVNGALGLTGTKYPDFHLRAHPLISPLLGSYQGLPKNFKVHVTMGSVEVLGDDIKAFIAKLREDFKAAGLPEDAVDVYNAIGGVHDHQLVFPDWKITAETYAAQAKWVKKTDWESTTA